MPHHDSDPFDLNRFVTAQAGDYSRALAELRAGRKQSHWIWYVFPQLRGLGRSGFSEFYGVASLDEARAYLAHAVLGARLRESVRAMIEHHGRSAESILGGIDALKFRSCLTLFAQAAPDEPLFVNALHQYFGGEADPRTLALLS